MPKFETDGPTMATHVEFEHQSDEPKPLTVADVLKRRDDAIALSGYFSLYWDGESGNWIVHQAGSAKLTGGIRFASPDESAACAEFLRLVGGDK